MKNLRSASMAFLITMVILAVSVAAGADDETVAFNVESKKYQCLECRWAIACTKNCIEIPRSEAKRRKGVACKVCWGSCERSRNAAELQDTVELQGQGRAPVDDERSDMRHVERDKPK